MGVCRGNGGSQVYGVFQMGFCDLALGREEVGKGGLRGVGWRGVGEGLGRGLERGWGRVGEGLGEGLAFSASKTPFGKPHSRSPEMKRHRPSTDN